LRRRVDRAAPRSEIRWLEPANLHVTLWFIGEIPAAAVDPLAAALHAPFAGGVFELRFAGFGAFPESGSPRVIWLGIERGRTELVSLYAQVRDRLGPLGYEPERRPFAPHLTVARVKEVKRSDVLTLRKLLASAETGLDPARADSVTLFRSHTSPHGARYESLLRVPLK
jgi:2'-5' RNA ligase